MSSGAPFDSEHLSLDAPSQHPVEVFCVGSHVSGTLHSGRPRVSDHLEADEHVLEIIDATLKPGPGATSFVEHRSVFVNKSMMLFVLDLTPDEWASGSADATHPTDPHEVLASVGDFWISGRLKLPVGADLHQFLAHSNRKFIPIAEADIYDYDEQTPCTVLVNRDHLEAVVKLSGQ
jgi:hypothetical protein